MNFSNKWLLSIALTCTALCDFSAQAAASQFCKKLFSAMQKIDDSRPSGVLMHGEHWVDLILAQGSSREMRHLNAFSKMTENLLSAADIGKLDQVNEKIDGSPSIVVGFSATNEPFVAYKGHFNKKVGQSLVTRDSKVEEIFKRSEGLKNTFAVLLKELIPALTNQSKQFKDFVFQGDLLFTEGDNRRSIEKDKIVIQANSITYEIDSTHPYFQPLREARVGVVFHTVGNRRINEDGTVLAESSSSERELRDFVSKLRNQNVFVIDPFKDQISIAQSHPLSSQTKEMVQKLLFELRSRMRTLSPSFTSTWGSKYEALFRIFFNSGLRPPNNGGIYREIAEGRDISIDQVILNFRAWTLSREEQNLQADFTAFAKNEHDSLHALLQSYVDAIRIQTLILPSLKEAFSSKLGGGDSEGLMLKTSDSVVKLVDRLDFTMLNNQRWNRRTDIKPLDQFSTPFNNWNPQAVYIVLKGQPVHGGHIAMIQAAVHNNPGKKIFILLSSKEPNLDATDWRSLGATDTKKKLLEKEYTHVFSVELRRTLLEQGLKNLPIEILIEEPFNFWNYLRSAKAAGLEGQVQLIVGEKEVQEQRYAIQQQELSSVFQLQPIELKLDGISGTQVRESLRKLALGNESEKLQSLAFLDGVYGYIKNKTFRRGMIQKMASEWKTLDDIAVRLTTPKPKTKKPRTLLKKKSAA